MQKLLLVLLAGRRGSRIHRRGGSLDLLHRLRCHCRFRGRIIRCSFGLFLREVPITGLVISQVFIIMQGFEHALDRGFCGRSARG